MQILTVGDAEIKPRIDIRQSVFVSTTVLIIKVANAGIRVKMFLCIIIYAFIAELAIFAQANPVNADICAYKTPTKVVKNKKEIRK